MKLKREVITIINKTIIAFTNTRGGTLYASIGDSGSVVGVADSDAACRLPTGTLRDTKANSVPAPWTTR